MKNARASFYYSPELDHYGCNALAIKIIVSNYSFLYSYELGTMNYRIGEL